MASYGEKKSPQAVDLPMPRKPKFTIVIEFDRDQADRYDLMLRVRHYGDDLWRAFRDEPRVTVDFDVVDTAWDRVHFVTTSKIIAKRAAKIAEDLLQKANLTALVSVSGDLH